MNMDLETFESLDVDAKKKFYLSGEWHDFVMSQLDSSEKADGLPKVYGLRRVSELLLGDVIESKPTEIFPVQGDGLGRASVVYSITFKWWDGSERSYADVADAFNDGQNWNIDDEFIVFALATASTRAEGRALKKSLKLKTCTYEEISARELNSNKKAKVSTNGITENQILFINRKCEQLNVEIDKFIKNNFTEEGYDRLEDLTKDDASLCIQKLNM